MPSKQRKETKAWDDCEWLWLSEAIKSSEGWTAASDCERWRPWWRNWWLRRRWLWPLTGDSHAVWNGSIARVKFLHTLACGRESTFGIFCKKLPIVGMTIVSPSATNKIRFNPKIDPQIDPVQYKRKFLSMRHYEKRNESVDILGKLEHSQNLQQANSAKGRDPLVFESVDWLQEWHKQSCRRDHVTLIHEQNTVSIHHNISCAHTPIPSTWC